VDLWKEEIPNSNKAEERRDDGWCHSTIPSYKCNRRPDCVVRIRRSEQGSEYLSQKKRD
jgi:hypothetical protein